MGTITQRTTNRGTVYTAQIRLKRGGKIVHSESKTFERKTIAQRWMTAREAGLQKPGALNDGPDPTFSTVIRKYLDESVGKMGKTKRRVLEAAADAEVGKLKCSEVTSVRLVEWVNAMRDCGPATRRTYVSHLSPVFKVAQAAWGFPLVKQQIEDAMIVLKKLGTTAKSEERTRRPTLDELDKLLTYFKEVRERNPESVPMVDLIVFSIFSGRRQGETCRMLWSEIESGRVLVRQMKDPDKKATNNVYCDLTPEAQRVIEAQPKGSDRVFPYSAPSVSTIFHRACRFLKIEDLTFHDMRHEAASRLFEMGWTIPHVAAVTGHKTWESLQRYSHVRQTGDKYASWKWLEFVTHGD
ncbi:site-specific integrase [Paraburkholderia sp. JPY303]|uniref:tyrosine-type recombinase/integrase n=1 Tax=Paraburkholderia atlantica TaxID=2654982 RepID=UPI00159104DA|nr:site-specific integrase [Paraburkholderia atlantica]NUY33252.1 site-specific integrase [Paraburkholderia atlantica]